LGVEEAAQAIDVAVADGRDGGPRERVITVIGQVRQFLVSAAGERAPGGPRWSA
jgi:hypothetical protein